MNAALNTSLHRNLVELSPDAVVLVDASGSITLVNRRTEEWFGYSREELLGRPVELLIPARHRSGHVQLRSEFRRSPSTRTMGTGLPLTGLRRDGSEFAVDCALSPVDGQVLCVIRDISERKRAEDASHFLARASFALSQISKSDLLFRGLSNLAVSAIAHWAAVDWIESDGAIRRRAVSRAALPNGCPAEDFSIPGTADAARNGRSILVPELPHPGVARTALVVGLELDGRPAGALTLASCDASRRLDIADLRLTTNLSKLFGVVLENARRLENALRAAQSREDLIANISHDLKTPLTAISLGAQTLSKFAPELPDEHSGRTAALARALSISASRAKELVHDLLDFARLEAGRLEVRLQLVRLEELVEAALVPSLALAEAKGIRIEPRIEARLPVVRCDRNRMIQVIANLLDNAVKFTPQGGWVAIRALAHLGGIKITVSDSGPGISRSDLPHLFDRYWRASDSDRHGGSGLGLAIAQGIVQAHGGSIWAENEPGAGARFSFTLPVDLKNTPRGIPPDGT